MKFYEELIINGNKCKTKKEVLELIAETICEFDMGLNSKVIIEGLLKREEISSTGFDNGIAIPHTKVEGLKEAQVVIVQNIDVDWNSIDGKNTNVAICILVPNTEDNIHLEILSSLTRKLINDDFTNSIKKSPASKVVSLLNSTKQSNVKEDKKEGQINVVAVTACTTGIAHTFMAAENLEKYALENNFNIKVETRGQGGAGNVLTESDIKNADYVIVCKDVNVPLGRFNGKKVLIRPVKDGVHNPEKLFNDMLTSEEFVSDEKDESSKDGKFSAYQSLMSGVTYMLPFTIAGGILIAMRFFFGTTDDIAAGVLPVFENIAFGEFFGNIGGLLFSMMLPFLAAYIAFSIGNRAALMPGILAGLMASENGSGFLGAIVGGFLAGFLARFLFARMKSLPKSLQGSYQILFMPLIAAICIGIFMVLFGVPIGALNSWLTSSLTALQDFNPILLGALVGAMMATDMGGPINKAAYITGTLLLAEGNQFFMAAVMAGGMVPPLAIALSTVINKNLYTQEEREAGKTNWILGLSFITEGAIPFAAADPKRVIPALMIGSAIAGAMTMAFGILLPAPHGGIFVFPLINSPLVYLTCIATGMVVGALMLRVFKKGA